MTGERRILVFGALPSTVDVCREKEIDNSLLTLDNGNLEIPRGADETDFTCASDKYDQSGRYNIILFCRDKKKLNQLFGQITSSSLGYNFSTGIRSLIHIPICR